MGPYGRVTTNPSSVGKGPIGVSYVRPDVRPRCRISAVEVPGLPAVRCWSRFVKDRLNFRTAVSIHSDRVRIATNTNATKPSAAARTSLSNRPITVEQTATPPALGRPDSLRSEAVRVVELWRYPVKSMQGERLDAAEIGMAGIVGDRQWALRDRSTGLTLTARRVPELLFATPHLDDDIADGALRIELPDGTVTADDAVLSRWLDRDVTLCRAGEPGTYEIAADFEHEDRSEWTRWEGPSWSFHDSTRIHMSIASTGSVGAWDPRRFRANVIVDAADGSENELIGALARVGTALVEVTKPIDRCVMTTRPQPGIDRDLDVLRTINATRRSTLGVGTLVRTPGHVALGDELAALDS